MKHLQQRRIGLVVHNSDTVATLLDDWRELTRMSDGLAIEPGIPFGHKVAIHPMRAGDAVIKYGIAIGHATQDIALGSHVHVHNVR